MIVSINITLLVGGQKFIRVLVDILPSPAVELGRLRASSLTRRRGPLSGLPALMRSGHLLPAEIGRH